MPHWQLKHKNGETYPAEIHVLTIGDARSLKKLGWEQTLDWSIYRNSMNPATPYKLLVVGNNYIQGAIAYQIKDDYVFVDLLESAPINRYNNPSRQFLNVVDILLGHVCKQSFDHQKEGFVAFLPKTNLYSYYERKFGAKRAGMGLMYLDTVEAMRLIELYYR